MAIIWRKSLEVGHPEIDHQHQELFSHVNKLLEACSYGKGLEEIVSTMQFLEDYVVTHFKREENLMLKNHYPEFQAHKGLHTQFISDFNRLKSMFEVGGPTVLFVMEANQLLVDWLVSHVTRVDRKLATFLVQAA